MRRWAGVGKRGLVPDLFVLCYHVVAPGCADEMAVAPAALRRQLRGVLARGYRPATFTAAVTAAAAGRLRHDTLAVTFDDAFASVGEYAAPVLEQLGVPGTVFAPTDLVTAGQPMSWPGLERHALTPEQRRPMRWRELGELAAAGWEIGSHSGTHARLPDLPPGELQREVARSRAVLEDRLGRPGTAFAYPFGAVDDWVAAAVRAAGYTAAAGLGRGAIRAPWCWPRVGVYRGDHRLRFRAKSSRLARSQAFGPVVAAARTGQATLRGAARRGRAPVDRPDTVSAGTHDTARLAARRTTGGRTGERAGD
jgi:peptidoglycan/xylan/chitin deacetylase (PgdA/CDA1 family)